jgi:hypothetical protein
MGPAQAKIVSDRVLERGQNITYTMSPNPVRYYEGGEHSI